MTEEISVGLWGRVGKKFESVRAFRIKLIDDWKNVLKRSYAIRTTAFWSLLGGLVVILPLVSEEAKEWIGVKAYIAVFLLLFVTTTVARVMKQPGTGDE